MSEIEGIFKTPVRNWLFTEDYNWAEGSHRVPDDDREIAVIREYLLGNMAGVRLRAKDVSAAISMVQTLEHAATTIRNKLALMEELAEKAVNGYYTDTDKASMQEQFEELANDINDIVDSSEYDGNKLFTDKGQTITRVVTRAIGKERTIHLFARDLSFDAESVDLTKDAKAALRTVNKTLKQAVEYSDYLRSQYKLLQDAMTGVENEMAGAAGVDSCDFETEITQQFVACLSAKILEDKETFSHIQFNITADEVLHLVGDGTARW